MKALVVDVTKTAAVTVVKELASANDGGERGFLPGQTDWTELCRVDWGITPSFGA